VMTLLLLPAAPRTLLLLSRSLLRRRLKRLNFAYTNLPFFISKSFHDTRCIRYGRQAS
jgi:hypothetical protein